jgi:hypothetical protein
MTDRNKKFPIKAACEIADEIPLLLIARLANSGCIDAANKILKARKKKIMEGRR